MIKYTPNGKIDRTSLAKYKPTSISNYEPPTNETQNELVKIFENILNLPKIGINDNFFDLGGDSLSAIKLQIEAFNKGINLLYKDIFNYPTIKQLSQKISSNENSVKNDNFDYTEIDSL